MQVWLLCLDFIPYIFINIWASGETPLQWAVVPWLCYADSPFSCPSSLRERSAKPGPHPPTPCLLRQRQSPAVEGNGLKQLTLWAFGLCSSFKMSPFLETCIPACSPHRVCVFIWLLMTDTPRYPTFWRSISLEHIDIWLTGSQDVRDPNTDVLKIFSVRFLFDEKEGEW